MGGTFRLSIHRALLSIFLTSDQTLEMGGSNSKFHEFPNSCLRNGRLLKSGEELHDLDL